MKEIIIIGSGMGALTAAAMLTADGHQVTVLEQNYLPGGCTSAYYRQGYIFEAGATTLVGLDDDMPLKHVLERTGIQLDLKPLELPMQVHLADGARLNRYQNLEQWIGEAERVFGKKGQRDFWTYCYKVSGFVWRNSLKQLSFPPRRLRDLPPILRNFSWEQPRFAMQSFRSMRQLLKKYDLLKNKRFVDFVNEQLLITAQNHIDEVNVLFGATALCYTNYGNYYVYGGLIQLVKPICAYIEAHGGRVLLREEVQTVQRIKNSYHVTTSSQTYKAPYLISGIPINDTLPLFKDKKLQKKYTKKILTSEKLNSAFQMGIGYKRIPNAPQPEALHHQIHLPDPLPYIQSKSIFLSLSDPIDIYRAPLDKGVASVSTHVPHPAQHQQLDKIHLTDKILQRLDDSKLITAEQVEYTHASTPSSWASWVKRKAGFVGGYPQYFKIKPWQMLEARLDQKGAYICGDTTYPGQGIPGTCLSGLIAYTKFTLDHVH